MDATPPESVFLVFGDLHGKILPAFRLASAWTRDHGTPLAGILQVGDMGYFPDPNTIDRATLRHAKDDPLELGTFDIVELNPLADRVFDDPHAPPGCGSRPATTRTSTLSNGWRGRAATSRTSWSMRTAASAGSRTGR